MPNSRRTVVVMVGSQRQYNRDVLRGIARYVRRVGDWRLETEPTQQQGALSLALALEADGAILFMENRRQLEAFRQAGTPFVNLSSTLPLGETPHVSNEGKGIAQLAIEHFLKRGIRNVAFCDLNHRSFVRRNPFEAEALARNLNFTAFEVAYRDRHKWIYEHDRDELDAWLAGLPKPVGILGHNDVRGRQIVDGCRRVGLHVPTEAAVLGVDNELPHCELCDPPLSSIVPAAEQIGFSAAEILDGLMNGVTPDPLWKLIPPLGVVTRQSTEMVATADPAASRAVRFIRQNAHRSIGVNDVVEAVGLSRTTLDLRFRKAFGHTPHEEIVRVRLQTGRQLLSETDLTLDAIAVRTGFRHAEYFGAVFRKRYGQTPGEYRRQSRTVSSSLPALE
ncbi:MAG: DNA-binding transcriptional regulator [Planctomycetota bacterium]